jgi:outer membrane PBP1 activator LpoA protein
VLAPAIIPPPVAAEPSPPAVSRVPSDTMVLVLPLQSPLYGRAAEAVRAGFLAAASMSRGAEGTQVLGHGDDGVLPAFTAAAETDPALVIGPLTRDDLKTVITMAPVQPRMLALNQPDDATTLPEHAYALALSVESDAVMLARRAREDNVRAIVVVASDAPLQRRFAGAFIAAWERAGGAPPRQYRFDANPDVLALLRRELAARPADATVLAVGSNDAALAKSFLPPGPVYASSQITDALSSPMLRDLDGVRYVEIPWLADPSNPAFARLPRANLGDPVLERLYALGADAFVIAELLASPVPPDRIELEGATGHLSLLPSRLFAREGRVMLIRDGQSIPSPAAQ